MVNNESIFDKKLNLNNSKSKLFINRELSWIDFNFRVLHQYSRTEIPLLERMNFLGITASNLDEFIMVRFSSVLNKVRSEIYKPELSGLYPQQEYRSVLKSILYFKSIQEDMYNKLIGKLKKENIMLCTYNSLNKDEKNKMDRIFDKLIFPLLTPVSFDSTKDFPLIKTKQKVIIINLSENDNKDTNILSFIPIDNNISRLYSVNESKYILLEEIIYNNLSKLFINKNIIYYGMLRILREADIELDSNKDIYIVDRMKDILKQREVSRPIFMDISSDIPKDILKLVIDIFNIDKNHIYKCIVNDLTFLSKLSINRKDLRYKVFKSQTPKEIIGSWDMFRVIDSGDLLLQHPYESFDPIVKFLEHAADNEDVLAIRQTLYRVSSDQSPIVKALCKAARNGKQVNVFLEIKARFDEDQNISLIEKLRLSGCKIIYGIEGLKTHCKMLLVAKRTKKNSIKLYTHIGTGNYNDRTSNIYTDISYFTSNEKIGRDIISIFNVLSGYSEPRKKVSKVLYSPYNIRTTLYELIDREIANVKNGDTGSIILKLNSLSDEGIIKKLYKASDKGVKVKIFVRGICSMKPINKNIIIRSLIGKYLEHSRIYYFFNKGKNEVFISSADLLTRNLDRRVEIMIPITEKNSKTKLLHVLHGYSIDTFNSYEMLKDGKFHKIVKKDKEVNIHKQFENQAINTSKFKNIPLNLKNKKRV